MFCREQAAQVRGHLGEIRSKGADLVVVAPANVSIAPKAPTEITALSTTPSGDPTASRSTVAATGSAGERCRNTSRMPVGRLR